MHHIDALRGKTRLTIVAAVALASGLAMSPPQQATVTTDGMNADGAVATDAATYRVGPEDLIEVFVWNEEDLSTEVMVRPDGRISLPLVNELQASGRTPEEIQKDITTGLREYIDNPVVSVLVKEINSGKISVLGEVRDAGRFLLRQETTVLDAIAMAGGFTEYANRGNVVIVRHQGGSIQRIKVDVNDLLGGNDSQLVVLHPNDTVYVR